MNKKMIILLFTFLTLFITGCDSSSKQEKNNNDNEKEELVYIEPSFKLYKVDVDGYSYTYNNTDVYVNDEGIVIDNENKKVYDTKNKKMIDYNKYTKDNPSKIVISFAKQRNECREKIFCDSYFGCSMDNFAIQDIQYLIYPDGETGVTPDYLSYEWCPIEISDDIVKELEEEGYKVWGRGLADAATPPYYDDSMSTPLSIAIEISGKDRAKTEKYLFDKYGLAAFVNRRPEKYSNLVLSESTCETHELNCEKVD